MERRFLHDVAKQFRSLCPSGEHIAIRTGFPKDFRDKRYSTFHKKGGLHNHFQGIGRSGHHLFVTGSQPHGTARSDLFAFRLGSRTADPGPWGSNLMRSRDPSQNDRLVSYHSIDDTLWHAGSFALCGSTMIVPLEGSGAGSRIAFIDVDDAEQPVRIHGHDIVRAENKAGVCAATTLPGGRTLLAIWTDSDEPGAGGVAAGFHLDILVSDAAESIDRFTLAGRYEPPHDHGFHRQFQGLDFVWENGLAGERLFLIGFENVSPVQPHPTDPGENRAYLFKLALPEEWLEPSPVPVPSLPPDFATFVSARVFDNDGDWFNMDAGASAYVDSNQQLIVYAVHHFLTPLRGKKTGDTLGFKCVEFRATEFIEVVDRIEDAWVELYEDGNCNGRRLALIGPWDSSIENTRQCFADDEPFEQPISVRFQIPADRAFVLYPELRFEGHGAIVLRGDGRVREVELAAVASLDIMRSCRFIPLSAAASIAGANMA